MSFGVASCSDLLQKGQKSDEYGVLCFEARSGFGAQETEDSQRLAEVRAPKPLGRWGRFGFPADGVSSMSMLQAGADETEQKTPFKNFSATDI